MSLTPVGLGFKGPKGGPPGSGCHCRNQRGSNPEVRFSPFGSPLKGPGAALTQFPVPWRFSGWFPKKFKAGKLPPLESFFGQTLSTGSKAGGNKNGWVWSQFNPFPGLVPGPRTQEVTLGWALEGFNGRKKFPGDNPFPGFTKGTPRYGAGAFPTKTKPGFLCEKGRLPVDFQVCGTLLNARGCPLSGCSPSVGSFLRGNREGQHS